MAGHFHHGRGPPGARDEPDIMSLHPRVRPFDPERYHPQDHILPPTTFYHFTDFDRRAPADLLLREPESHLSHQAREVRTSLLHFLQCILHFLHIPCFHYVSSRSTRGYGSIVAREWYAELPNTVRDIEDDTGFGPFCAGLSRYLVSRTLMGAFVER
ncbi:hypothetical protein CsSME_00028604 [Camellia sinensis var. sinensis]